jgi:hypothetical protein
MTRTDFLRALARVARRGRYETLRLLRLASLALLAPFAAPVAATFLAMTTPQERRGLWRRELALCPRAGRCR